MSSKELAGLFVKTGFDLLVGQETPTEALCLALAMKQTLM